MEILKWKVRNLIGALLLLVLVYVWIRPRQYTYTASVEIPKIQPHEVWEYVADFSNMIHLNPTIKSFIILSEKGNYEHWQYITEYTENLSHWPYLQNVGIGEFSIHSNRRKKSYYVNSTHTTCFLHFFCLYSESDFKFTLNNVTDPKSTISTYCEEKVRYHCPMSLYFLCKREIVFQRMMIMKNLQAVFEQRV